MSASSPGRAVEAPGVLAAGVICVLSTAWDEPPRSVDHRAHHERVDEYFLDLGAVRPTSGWRTSGRRFTIPGFAAASHALKALSWWQRHVGGDPDGLPGFAEALVRLRASAEHRDGMLLWRRDMGRAGEGGDAGAYSATAQALSASVFVREHVRTGDWRSAADARAAMAPLLEADSKLGFVSFIDDGPVLEEAGAADESHILSAWIFALWGMRDVAVALGDRRARSLYDASVDALAATISYYDTGWWTRHSLCANGEDIATRAYHRLHSAQIDVLARLTDRVEFVRAAKRWRRYETRVNAGRALVRRARRALRRPPRHTAARPGRVRMVVHAPYSDDPRVTREAWAMRDAGLDVEVVCLRDPDVAPRRCVDDVEVIGLGIEHVRGAGIRGIVSEYLRFTASAGVALARRTRNQGPELVHVHAPPDFLVAASVVPRLRGARLMLDIHDFSADMFDARFGRSLAARAAVTVLRLVERLACGLADRVITVHRPYADQLVRRGVPQQKIGVVMNAIDERALEPALQKRVPEKADDAFTVAYHGTITPWYGLDLLVEAVALACADVPNIRAVIVGHGDALETTRRLARDLHVDDRLDFVGFLSHSETLKLIATADCGVIPNKPTPLNRFALSSKLFEYVALGIPVAVARLETLALHFDDDEVLFFTPGDASALAGALVSIVTDPQAASARAERARSRAEREYSWRRNRELLLSSVFELIPQPPPAAWRPSWWAEASRCATRSHLSVHR